MDDDDDDGFEDEDDGFEDEDDDLLDDRLECPRCGLPDGECECGNP